MAKGEKPYDVLSFMAENRIMGVRGNHDQPVVQWRTWMEWAGGQDWEAYMDSLAFGSQEHIVKTLQGEGRAFPKGWKWGEQHWKIARFAE